MQLAKPEEFSLYKFEPNNIIMLHKPTRILYQYYQIPQTALRQNNLWHNHLQQPILLNTGLLYKKGFTCLQTELSNRLKLNSKVFYEEEELVNTFVPVLECMSYLHQKNQVHGSVSPQNVIFNEEGEVMLRDGLVEVPNNKYYDQYEPIKDRTKHSDMRALGNILLECSLLVELEILPKHSMYLEMTLRRLMPKFSRGFILTIYILIKGVEKFYSQLRVIFEDDAAFIDSQEGLLSLYKKIKNEKETNGITTNNKNLASATSPLITNSNFKNPEIINKANFSTPRKTVSKLDDLENKKSFVEETKKKNIERVARIIEKNYGETNKKPDMVLKKMSNYKFNMAQGQLQGQYTPEQKPIIHHKKITKQEILKFGSPMKRLRTLSKKKAS